MASYIAAQKYAKGSWISSPTAAATAPLLAVDLGWTRPPLAISRGIPKSVPLSFLRLAAPGGLVGSFPPLNHPSDGGIGVQAVAKQEML